MNEIVVLVALMSEILEFFALMSEIVELVAMIMSEIVRRVCGLSG